MRMKVNLHGVSHRVVCGMMNNNIANGIKNKYCKIIDNQNQTLLEFNTVVEFKSWWRKIYGDSETGLTDGTYVFMDFY